ncbi:hypothetical protein HNR19_001491 [Nocardioides thalensis]|uniref:Uncharacterized protein n=1 Tax=Nocardioides thalensis TaxID=1914755 RepID=A0A853C397_9ACTN|nr:hypothetical protein [Nocardioides thalensis]NYJ00793.1 hypothetical protein [Nocardioides thalensis]
MAQRTLSDVARAMDRSGLLTVERARVLQLAAAADRPAGYKCSHPELAGMGWTHPWPDEPMTPHACCRDDEHCPSHWSR